MSVPECPEGHASKSVVRAGWYGGGEGRKVRRQRWKCTPKKGTPHRFAETLPRLVEVAHRRVCDECATTLEPWEGQPAPRLYEFTARQVAHALALVANGSSYRNASASIRAEAGRPLSTDRGRTRTGKPLAEANRHGQLVSDWVDTFAPVIWAHYAPKEWPEHLMLDSDELRYRSPGASRGLLAFHVLGAVGYDAKGRRYVARLEAVRRVNTQVWAGFLRRLGGTPEVVVTDGGTPASGAALAWPAGSSAPTPYRCEWHLARNITQALPAAVQADRDDGLHLLIRRSQVTIADWSALVNEIHARASGGGYLRAVKSITGIDSIVRQQLAVRGPRRPRSTGPVEQFFRDLDNAIGDRAAKVTNKKRADALLMLLAAKHNGWVDERQWAELIRDHLARHHGHAPEQRRHTDPASKPSLR